MIDQPTQRHAAGVPALAVPADVGRGSRRPAYPAADPTSLTPVDPTPEPGTAAASTDGTGRRPPRWAEPGRGRRHVEPRDVDDENPAARVSAHATGLAEDRPRDRQRHRHPRRAGLRHHATLIPTPGGTEIADNRSINGTFVSGSRVTTALLNEGDVVTIGNVDLVFTGGSLVRRTETAAATGTGGLDVRRNVDDRNNKTLLDNISLTARPGTLTAVIGPSGAGKSTLARLIAGYTHPTSGTVSFEGHNIHADYASLRSRIGMVPQDDVVHGQLTVNQALMYAAELRLPPDTTKEDRRVVAEVLSELEMTSTPRPGWTNLRWPAQARLGGAGVADRSVAADSRRAHLGSGPGAGPAGDDHAASTGRRRARRAGGHPLADLPRRLRSGAAAGAGRQDGVLRAARPDRPGDGHHQLGRHLLHGGRRPQGANDRFLALSGLQPAPPPADEPSDLGEPVHTSLRRQFSTIVRRRRASSCPTAPTSHLLALLPFIMGVLSLAVPGTVGWRARPGWAALQRTGPDSGLPQRRRGVHGNRADHPRPHRRTSDLPP